MGKTVSQQNKQFSEAETCAFLHSGFIPYFAMMFLYHLFYKTKAKTETLFCYIFLVPDRQP